MLLLFELEELNSFYIEVIKTYTQEHKVYVVSEQLYLYFRYTLKINVDMANLRDNHIYICTGEILTMPVYCRDLKNALDLYGFNCDVYKFKKLHDVNYELEVDWEE